jgi:exosortase/archaeosortase family protein
MTNPFRTAPRCVQWAAVLLAALPAFQTVVSFFTLAFGRFMLVLEISLPSVAIVLGLAGGILFGLNLVRLLFACLVAYWTAGEIFAWYHLGFFSMSLVSDVVTRLLPCVSLVLCFLPAANRYFADAPAPTPVSPAKPAVTARAAKLLAGGLLVGIILVKVLAPVLREARYEGRDLGAVRSRIMDADKDIQIGNNLRLLSSAADQFALEHSGASARFTDLVGPGKYLPSLPRPAGEEYPDVILPGTDPVARMPDGTLLIYDRQTFLTRRAAPSSASRSK